MDKIVDSIPSGGEWWKDVTRRVFVAKCKELIEHGYKPEEAGDFLADLYNAVVNEYGD